MSIIGTDTLKIYLAEYRLNKNTKVELSKCENIQEKNHFQVIYNTGEIDKYEKLKYNNDNMIVNFQPRGSLTAQVSVPKVFNGNNIDLFDSKANIMAYNYIFDSLSEAGITFDKKDIQNSRIDITRNIELDSKVSDYYPLMSMMPWINQYFQIGDTKYQGNKSYMLCIYDKILECEAKKKIIPNFYKNKNIMRIENRLLKSSKLRMDSKQIGINLLSIQSLCDQDNFKKVQDLYMAYIRRLFKYDYLKLKDNNKSKSIEHFKNFLISGLSPLKALAYINPLFRYLSIDEIALHIYPDKTKNSKQKRYTFKKMYFNDMKKVKENNKDSELVFNEMYSELKSKALKKAA